MSEGPSDVAAATVPNRKASGSSPQPTATITVEESGSGAAGGADTDAAAFTEGWSEASRYALVAELARGGGGRIAIAIDRKLGRRVALKRALDRDGEIRLEREALVLARLEHPAIVPIHDAGLDGEGSPYYTMKLVGGQTLAKRIDAATTFDQRLALLPAVTTVADAIAYAHGQRVIHRDLKPGNVLVGAFGEVAVIDWGLGKVLDDGGGDGDGHGDGDDDGNTGAPAAPRSSAPGLTEHGAVIGTPAYMAPEQAAGAAADERADVYAIGAILYHALTGALPYGGLDSNATLEHAATGTAPPPIDRREPRVPDELAAIVGKAMAPRPADRYPTARELADDLHRYQTGRLVAAHRYRPGARAWRWIRRHRAGLAAAIAVAATGVATGVLAFGGGPDTTCAGVDAPVTAVWNPAVRATGEQAFAASGAPDADATWIDVAAALDAHAARISAMRRDACTAARVRRVETEQMMSDRMLCLDRRTSELAALVGVLTHADAAVVPRARTAVGALGRVDDCADVVRLRDAVPLPADPTARTEALAIEAELDRLDALDLAGKRDEWTTITPVVRTRADLAGWEPARARALVRSAAVEIIRGDLDSATVDLVKAAQAADRGHDDRTRARALIYLANLELAFRERPDRARDTLDLAAAAADRAGDDQLRASVLVYAGRLAGRLGNPADQVADAERALALSAKFVGNELYDTERALGDAYLTAERFADAEATYHRVIDRLRTSYGTDDHPDVAAALGGLGNVAYARGAYHSAVDLARQEIAIYERMGEANQYNHIPARESLAVAEIAAGDPAAAVTELAVLSTDCDFELGRLHSQCIKIRFNLGGALGSAGQYDPAIEVFRESLARSLEVDPRSPDAVDDHRNIGVLLEQQGRYRDALAEYRRALDARVAIDGNDASDAVTQLREDIARAQAGGR